MMTTVSISQSLGSYRLEVSVCALKLPGIISLAIALPWPVIGRGQ